MSINGLFRIFVVIIVSIVVMVAFYLGNMQIQKERLFVLSAVKQNEINPSLLKISVSVKELKQKLIELNENKFKECSSKAAELSGRLTFEFDDKIEPHLFLKEKINTARDCERNNVLALQYGQSFVRLKSWNPGMSVIDAINKSKRSDKDIMYVNL